MIRGNLIILVLCVVYAAANIEFITNLENEVENRIVGGENAKKGQFPYQISLRHVLYRQHFCGGSILNSRFLITAAHCTGGLHSNPRYVYAVVGARHLSSGIEVKLNKIYRHEAFDSRSLVNDVSLLRTTKKIKFTHLIQPIALPIADLPKSGDTEVLLSGWGQTSYPGQSLPNTLQFTHPHTLNNEECIRRFAGHSAANLVQPSMICTINAKHVGACLGDSGGPLVKVSDTGNKTLVGIVSWGIPCGRGFPDVFTRVFYHLEWIQDHIQKHSADFDENEKY